MIIERGGKADARIRTADPRIGEGPQLYHIGNDPFEHNNLAGHSAYDAIFERLEDRLNSWAAEGRKN